MAEAVSTRAYIATLVADFATALESVLGGSVTAAAGAPGAGTGWVVKAPMSGELRGTLSLWIERASALALTARVMGIEDGEPEEASVVDLLQEMWTQAASATSLKAPFTTVKAAVNAPVTASIASATLATFDLRAGDSTLRIAAWGDVEQAPVVVAVPPPSAASTQPSNAKLEVVLDIDLPLVVRFGKTAMTLKSLANLGPGSIVDMGRSPDEPVEMLVGDQVIARGEVVIVGGNYGVRITDLISSADRARSLEF